MRDLRKFIVIEGPDGCGKRTQTALLVQHLRATQITVAEFSFPQYGQPTAQFAEKYLQGKYGSVQGVHPEIACMMFAFDRFAARSAMMAALQRGDVVISDRFVASNMAYQGAKIPNTDERKKLFHLIDWMEYDIFGIPRPDLNIILVTNANIAQGLLRTTGKKLDMHEVDAAYQKCVDELYREIAATFPERYILIECVEDDQLLAKEEIAAKIWAQVQAGS